MTKNKQKEEFLDTLEKHIGIVIKIAGAYTRVSEDKQDLMHDIIFELWKSSNRFNRSCKVSTWIYRVALNVSMNYKRKQQHRFLFTSLNDFQEKEITSWLAEQDAVSELELLYNCIDKLNEINKAVILLYLDGNSHEEIAEITGISKTNVGTRIGRIKEELRRMANSKKE